MTEPGIYAVDGHRYTSTACRHGVRDRCRLTCKFCGKGCDCKCHEKDALIARQHERIVALRDEITHLKTALLDHVTAEVEHHFRECLPPYLFPGTETMPMPGTQRTTVRMALEDVWDMARRDVLRILDPEAPNKAHATVKERLDREYGQRGPE